MSELTKVVNIGAVIATQLEQVGITTYPQLKQAGAREAFKLIRQNDPSACINRLYALEGAVQGIRWHNLDPACKDELREFFNKGTK